MADLGNKPSFFSSVMSGIKGFVKGAFTGGFVGALVGGLIGAGLSAMTGGLAAPMVLLGAIGTGATFGGVVFSSIGSVAGAFTEVIRSREPQQPSAQDIVNIANIAFAQGVAASQHYNLDVDERSTKFRDRLAAERNQEPTRTR